MLQSSAFYRIASYSEKHICDPGASLFLDQLSNAAAAKGL